MDKSAVTSMTSPTVAAPARAADTPARSRESLASMPPAYFALIMATGIVSIGCKLLKIPVLPHVLAAVSIVGYPVLWVLFLTRLWRMPKRVLADLASHQRAPGFFTIVAGTGVLGAQMVVLYDARFVAHILWWVTVVLWAAVMYSVFTAVTIREIKPNLAEGINGGWLVAIVATQSVVVLGCVIGGDLVGDLQTTLYILLTFWLCGGMLYFWTISLIFYRYLFFRLAPGDLMPPYWINMGAVAISTVAGTMLAIAAGASPVLTAIRPFISGLTAMYWATATWWIPMLVILGVWRHYIRRFPFTYDPLYWGMVFPLGMYAVASYRMSQLFEVPLLVGIAHVSIVAGIAAWALTFFGLLRSLLRTVRT